jgi:hypothetical protein
MQFWGRVGDDSAYIRIQRRRLEWSLVGRQWVIEMAPITSITSILSVTAEPGNDISTLVVTTAVGSVEFLLRPETAEEAASLLVRLVAEAGEQSVASMASPVVDGGAQVDELINLRWMFDAAVVDEFDCDEEPARLLGF